ncbi:aromatic amino acid aminotransferase [Defluviimonas sp. 20V17]|uniref:Aminotransferase n=1 Tax=Allgaiera indica TaxID=765699 RepID=A0AAN4UNJ0_9RHOB|nr:amino acid aminotransferase [Allgaiera indica]KDB04744.1 aromatic amino acid aminotransferase [Defluviimonas sp. 20V17]GHD99130.1 aromatic amino acid aminotransferase [Allgaiera indica]SDW00218.1 aromatic-amino-acid transaminase [Allgaiera indica]
MLGNLKPQAPDKILELMALYRDDPRADKIDLGVGVYKNALGVTPIMRAVKAAEKQLWEAETTKSYTALVGDQGYRDAMAGLILGAGFDMGRVASAATPGGTGAVHMALELIKLAAPGAKVWVSDPTWPNHLSILKHLGMESTAYRYFDDETRGVDFDGMMADLARVAPGDVVLLHGCCHNPTGANLNPTQWGEVAAHLEKTGAVPLIDLAYQGFGDGLEADAAATRLLAGRLPEVLIAASCSKNFGIYRERAGILLALSSDPKAKDLTQGTLAYLNRQNFSFPPDHGARLVTMILTDPALKADWMAELEEVRKNMLALREQLAQELRRVTGSDRFGFIAQHRGMFSRLGATPEQVAALRADHGIYMVGDSRLNIAGLNDKTVPILAEAIGAAGI